MNDESMSPSLRSRLDHEPQVLKFGTSGRRGEVIHLTQLEIYINVLAELEYLQSLPRESGGVRAGEEFFFAYDLRPSSTRYVAEQGGRGEIAQAVEQAVRDAGMTPANLGAIPTPALTAHALARGRGSIMVTGSHIPFDRNGYKTNSSVGELLKTDEAPIGQAVERVRARVYAEPFAKSKFDRDGRFKTGSRPLPPADPAAAEGYVRRYLDFFQGKTLPGMRLLAYQHSSVGRDLLVEVLRRLGAEVFPAGRSDAFVPIDTEAIDAEQLGAIQSLLDRTRAEVGPIDAIVSADGDADRPLILGIGWDASGKTVARFFGGDLVGMVVAEYLRADSVVVPISCNDGIDRGPLADALEPRTKIGSPFVIAGMREARAAGKTRVCGWEANGGFLTGTDLDRDGRRLAALPTRDAMLPVLATLFAAREQGSTVAGLFDRLPRRFSRAALLRNFPRSVGRKVVERLSPPDPLITEVDFLAGGFGFLGGTFEGGPPLSVLTHWAAAAHADVARFFPRESGFGELNKINYTDGVRITFDNGDVAHVRPSGNADELRIYSAADTQARADEITKMGVAEPDGILRRLERAVM